MDKAHAYGAFPRVDKDSHGSFHHVWIRIPHATRLRDCAIIRSIRLWPSISLSLLSDPITFQSAVCSYPMPHSQRQAKTSTSHPHHLNLNAPSRTSKPLRIQHFSPPNDHDGPSQSSPHPLYYKSVRSDTRRNAQTDSLKRFDTLCAIKVVL